MVRYFYKSNLPALFMVGKNSTKAKLFQVSISFLWNNFLSLAVLLLKTLEIDKTKPFLIY